MTKKAKTITSKKQKLLRAIQIGGHANVVMGWLWLLNGLFWAVLYFSYSTPDSSNQLISIGSVFASLANSTYLFMVVLSISLGIFQLGIGTYIKLIRGPKTKLFLLLGAIVSAIFFLGIIPIIIAAFSLYGYYAYKKIGKVPALTTVKRFKKVTLKKQATVALVFILIAVGLSGIAYTRLNNYNSPSGTLKGADAQTAIKESNESYTSTRVLGYCEATPPPSVGCTYKSKESGFTATFPANSTFAGTPRSVPSSKRNYVHNTASAKKLTSFTGYTVVQLHFDDVPTDAASIQQRLHDSANDKYINYNCSYSPDSSLTQETVTPSTFKGMQALNVYTSGTFQGFDNKNEKCSYYSIAFMKGNTVYVLSAESLGTDKDNPTQESFNKFIDDFKLQS